MSGKAGPAEGSLRVPWGWLVEVDSKEAFPLNDGIVTVGRSDPSVGVRPDVDLGRFDPKKSVSRQHATFHHGGEESSVVDPKGATNGIFVNGVRLAVGRPHPLTFGDFLALGLVGLSFERRFWLGSSSGALPAQPLAPPRPRGAGPARGSSRFAVGMNENVEIDGTLLHVQTEDLGTELGAVLTTVYRQGEAVFSRRTLYDYFIERHGTVIEPVEMLRFHHHAIVAGVRQGRLQLDQG